MTRVIVPHPDDHRRAGLAGGHGGVDRLLGRLKRNARLLEVVHDGLLVAGSARCGPR